jgi:hypothetical protein
MADAADVVAPAVDQSGNTVIWWVGGSITDTSAVKAATEIGAATTYRITHDFTPDGFPLDSSQEKSPDDRLALVDTIESLGKISTTFGDGITYVDTQATAGHATVVLKPAGGAPSISGYFVVRRNVPNSTVAAAAQKATVYPVTLGKQRPGPITGTGKFTFKQQVVLTGAPVETTFAA